MRLTTRTVDTWRTPDGVAIRADVVQDIERPAVDAGAYLAGDFLPTAALLAGTTTRAATDWPVEFDPNDPDCGCLKGVQQCAYHRAQAHPRREA